MSHANTAVAGELVEVTGAVSFGPRLNLGGQPALVASVMTVTNGNDVPVFTNLVLQGDQVELALESLMEDEIVIARGRWGTAPEVGQLLGASECLFVQTLRSRAAERSLAAV